MRRRFEILWSKAEKHKVEHFLLMSAKEGEKETRDREKSSWGSSNIHT